MMDKKTDMQLDVFFDAAKNTGDLPNAAFLQAVLADAQAQSESRIKVAKPSVSSFSFTDLLRKIGGWQPASAMMACAFVGMYIGYSTPDTLTYINSTEQNAETLDDGSFSVASEIEELFQEGQS
jgi:hypothetical protein